MDVKHVYLAVKCKTPNCNTACAIKYIGEYSGKRQIRKLVPLSFIFECGDCKKEHLYKREELYPLITDQPPPPGFEKPF